jgi:hypothetical protein
VDAARGRRLNLAHFEAALQYVAERIAENRLSFSEIDFSFKRVTGSSLMEFAEVIYDRSKERV